MQLVKVISRNLMSFFSVGILQTLVKLVQVEILELIISSATGTGMLVKRALTSNETKVSSSGFIERCLILLMKTVLSLTKDEVLPQSFFKNFSDDFGSVFFWILGRPYNLAAGELEP